MKLKGIDFYNLVIGLSIDSGLHIKRIDPGSAASEEETLSIGDKIVSVSNMLYFSVCFADTVTFSSV